MWLEGEISNLRAPGSGHLYCTLKDDSSQIRAVIFRPTAIRLRFGLEDGRSRTLYDTIEKRVLPAWADRAQWTRMMVASAKMARERFSAR